MRRMQIIAGTEILKSILCYIIQNEFLLHIALKFMTCTLDDLYSTARYFELLASSFSSVWLRFWCVISRQSVKAYSVGAWLSLVIHGIQSFSWFDWSSIAFFHTYFLMVERVRVYSIMLLSPPWLQVIVVGRMFQEIPFLQWLPSFLPSSKMFNGAGFYVLQDQGAPPPP